MEDSDMTTTSTLDPKDAAKPAMSTSERMVDAEARRVEGILVGRLVEVDHR